MLEDWVTVYAASVPAYKAIASALVDGLGREGMIAERHEALVGRLIQMARAGEGQVDPEVQIALGVLFSSTGVRLFLSFVYLL